MIPSRCQQCSRQASRLFRSPCPPRGTPVGTSTWTRLPPPARAGFATQTARCCATLPSGSPLRSSRLTLRSRHRCATAPFAPDSGAKGLRLASGLRRGHPGLPVSTSLLRRFDGRIKEAQKPVLWLRQGGQNSVWPVLFLTLRHCQRVGGNVRNRHTAAGQHSPKERSLLSGCRPTPITNKPRQGRP